MVSFKNYLILLHKFLKKGRPGTKRRFSGFSWLNSSSFAGMEVSNQLRQVFKFIDTNSDGKISPEELSEVLLCLGHENYKTATKEAEGMVKEVDCNGDGYIDLDEFLRVVNISKDDDSLMDAYRIFDTDKNGLISAQELQKVLANLGFEKCGLHDCEKMIEGVDQDGDGFVDFDEFRCMMK